MESNSGTLDTGRAQTHFKGVTLTVPSTRIGERTVITTGRWLKMAQVQDEELVEGDIVADVTASAGVISNVHAAKNDVAKTTRLSFEHNVNGADVAELRAVLKRGDKKASETWLFRWTRN